MKKLLLLVSHLLVGAIGFAAGIYALPTLIAPPAPSSTDVQAHAAAAVFTGQFRRDLQGSDFLHWGEGTPDAFNTVIVWCDAFAQFITAARYR